MILHDYPLRAFNTFRMNAIASHFTMAESVSDIASIASLVRKTGERWLILGGGSNILFRGDFDGLVIKVGMKGIERHDLSSSESLVTVGAGVVWDDFVEWAVVNGFGGTENLSLIPGETGAAAVQNIGAYGAEICEIVEKVTAYDLMGERTVVINNRDCGFGYRDSVFKRELKETHIITSVTFRLSKTASVNIGYGNLAEELALSGDISYGGVRRSVIKIRRSKLPDPDQTGNAGSFFKNPVISTELADELVGQYPGIPLYPAGEGRVKAAAGWLIEQCGWKGYRRGDAGVYDKQALVLVNFGSSVGEEIIALAEEIAVSVESRFGIRLDREVEIV